MNLTMDNYIENILKYFAEDISVIVAVLSGDILFDVLSN